MFRKPMMSFSHSVNSIKGYFACIDRVCEIIDYPVDDENPEIGLNDDEITGEIEFRNISYNNMSGFNLKIASGEIINVVGKNQYDLVDLLLNFSKPDCGEILLDGVDIRKLNFNEYRKIFGVSIEDDQIMSASIAQNISLGGNDVDIDDVKEICERLGISKIIERFPDGYDTSISDDSISLSSGERKLICVARALISNPKILILNYPNYLSQDILKKVIEGKTTILLTPDEDTINFADKTISIK
ncbi:ATP-binding cassette domain-containing protein [Methanobrevibacter sp.]|uniref:ATP-binding cassette domain-containing protein n=1 Tax=Methanobrevibacter sp. TaxID=66852 RepID=UPI00345C03D8